MSSAFALRGNRQSFVIVFVFHVEDLAIEAAQPLNSSVTAAG